MFVDIFDNTNKPTEPQRTDRCSCGASSIRYINKSVRFAGWLGNARVSVSVFEVGKTVIAASADGGQRVTAVNRSAPGQQTHSHCRPIVLRFVFAPLLLVQLVFVVDFFVFSFFFFFLFHSSFLGFSLRRPFCAIRPCPVRHTTTVCCLPTTGSMVR